MVEVIVAGGGPTGMMLAGELSLAGVEAQARWCGPAAPTSPGPLG